MTLTNHEQLFVDNVILVDDTNAATITDVDPSLIYSRYEVFILAAGATSPSATMTITVPTKEKGMFIIKNPLGFDATVTTAGQSETAGSVTAGASALFTHDGDNVRIAGAAAAAAAIPTFIGAMVRKAANQTSANFSSATAITFDEEDYDTASFHDNATNNQRLTIPAAYNGNYAQVGGNVYIQALLGDASCFVELVHFNSSDVEQFCIKSAVQTLRVDMGTHVAFSAPVLVATGDYFLLRMLVGGGDTSVTVTVETSLGLTIVGQ